MRIAVINPNSTRSMTDKAVEAARMVAPGDQITGITCHRSPPAIQGPEDDALCRPFVLEEAARAEAEGAEAIVIACFDDPALAEVRAAARVPVIGIGEAAFHAAMLLGGRFSVVTTLPVAVPVIEDNIARYGITACAKVRAAGIKVLDLEEPGGAAAAKVSAEIGRAVAEEAPGAIVLGCAGMADLAAGFEAAHGLPVIDGVAAATVLARAMAALRP